MRYFYPDAPDALSAKKQFLKEHLLNTLAEHHLEVNPDKVIETEPNQPWTFLGLECNGRHIDVSRISIDKLKAKMRRKSRAIESGKEPKVKRGGWRQEPLLSTSIKSCTHQKAKVK